MAAGPSGSGLRVGDTMSTERFPAHYSVLISGPSGVGKLDYMLRLGKQFLDAGERIVFVTLDLHPDEVRTYAESAGIDRASVEGSRFVFVDCYSASATDRMDAPVHRKVFSVSSFSNLEGIGMAINKAAQEAKTPVRILFYTASTLFLHNSPQAIAKFVQIITSRVKTSIGFIAYAMHEGVHDVQTTNLLRSLVDGVIEIRFRDDMTREIRFHHMRGLKFTPGWTPVEEELLVSMAGGGPVA